MAKIGFNDAFDSKFLADLEKLVKLFKALGIEARDLNQALKSAKTFEEYKKNVKGAAEATNKLTKSEKKLLSVNERLKFAQSAAGQQYAKTTEEIRRQNKANREATKSQLAATKSTNRFGSAIKSFLFKANFLANVMSNIASTVFRAFTRAVRQGIDVIKNFDKSSARLAAVLGKTRKEISKLTKEAKQLGSVTQFTATEVTGLQIELAKLGFVAAEISAATPGILSFATATGADLAAAAKTAGAAVRVFGLNASETEDAVATLAVATTKSGLTFEAFDTILSTVGPVAKAYGFTLEDVVALTGELATAGFEANKAATATRNILLNLADTNGALAKSLGGSVDNFDDLIDGLVTLEAQGVPLGKMLELTDKRSVAAFSRFLEGAESARKLRDGITGVTKELQTMVDVQLDTLAGDIDLLKSAWEGFILSLSSDGGVLRAAVQLLTNAVLQAQNLDLAVRKFHKQNAEQLTRSVALLESLTNKQGTEFSKITEAHADATSRQLIASREGIIFHLSEIRKINLKEANALFDELLRQRKEQEAEELQALIEKSDRLREEEEKSDRKRANTTVEVFEDVSEKLKQLQEDEAEGLGEIDEAYDDHWGAIREQSEGAFEALEALENARFDNTMENLAEEREEQDKQRQLEIDTAQDIADHKVAIANELFNFTSVLFDRQLQKAEENAAKELANENLTAEQRKQIEKDLAEEKAKIQKKAAIVDKAQALFNIAIDTAAGIIKYASNPLTAPLIPFIIGLGLAQAAVVAATPIPQFYKGTDSAPGGGAIVGEKGSELMVGPDGSIGLTPDTATLMDIQKGTKIYPSDVTQELLGYTNILNGLGGKRDERMIMAVMNEMKHSNEKLRHEIKNKPVASSTQTAAGIFTSIYKGNTTIKRLEKYFK